MSPRLRLLLVTALCLLVNLPRVAAAPAPESKPHATEIAKEAEQHKEIESLRVAAEAGDAAAMNTLAGYYYVGYGVPKNNALMVSWTRRAAEQGNVRAQFSYGALHDRGELIPKNTAEALKWFRLAAAQKDSHAELALSSLYKTGNGVPADPQEAARWLRLAAEHGHFSAQQALGHSLDTATLPLLRQERTAWFRRAAMQGSPHAMLEMSEIYMEGKDVPADRTHAIAWMLLAQTTGHAELVRNIEAFKKELPAKQLKEVTKQARALWDKVELSVIFSAGGESFRNAQFHHTLIEKATAGDPEAQLTLAIIYQQGDGTIADPELAAVWCRKAAEHGLAAAQCVLAEFHESGIGVPQDPVEMFKWYRKAAEQGDAQAQFRLGSCYRLGEGVAPNPQLAQSWTLKSANQGHAIAQGNMGGFCLEKGDPQYYPEAVRWFKLSAEQGHPKGMFKLGLMYSLGLGHKENKPLGFAWMLLCLPTEDETFRKAIEAFRAKLSPEELKHATDLSVEIKKTL